jgi:sulfur carrier protein
VIVRLNGEERELPDGATVTGVLALLDVAPDARGVAVAVDREVVPRREWDATVLLAGAQIEILMAIQGG